MHTDDLFGFYVAEHGDLLFDGVLQSGGAATHDLSAKVRWCFDGRRVVSHRKDTAVYFFVSLAAGSSFSRTNCIFYLNSVVNKL